MTADRRGGSACVSWKKGVCGRMKRMTMLVAVMLVLAIEGAIWINLSVPYFMGNPIFYLAYLIGRAIDGELVTCEI